MSKLLTYSQAKKQINLLQNYIDLIENYNDTISKDNWIIKQYALSNSISKVIKASNEDISPFLPFELDRDYVKKVILDNKDNDELQKLLKSAYLTRYKR